MEAEFNHLNHATWECKYHVVFTPKYRKKLLFGKIKRHLGQVFHDLARRKECRIEEGHLMPDHVHMLISIPPKYSVAQIIGYMKGKTMKIDADFVIDFGAFGWYKRAICGSHKTLILFAL